MSESKTSWTQDDFDSLCWHDNTIHAIAFNCPHEGYDHDLVLDIDFIVEWILTKPGGRYRFAVAPALLVFHGADKIRIDLGLCYKEMLEIDGIDREDISTVADRQANCHRFRYTIRLHSFSGAGNKIVVESAGFDQKLTKPPVLQDWPWLEDEAR
jgi:hypothetical protein